MEKVLRSGCLIKLLEWIDAEKASEANAAGCRHCGGSRLHKGDYERKPRGLDGIAEWNTRYSFDCAHCRRRTTPPSVRFLGRRVFAGVVVVLAAAMMHGATPKRVERLQSLFDIRDAKTLECWRAWWKENFVESGFWRVERSRFRTPLEESSLPASLVGAFEAEHCSGMVSLLRFLSPITLPGGLEGRVM